MGRTAWAEAEFADFLAAIENRADVERWRRLPGLHQLSRRGLEMARRLSEWREDEARRQNRPLRQVMRDDVLVAIAKRQPSSRRDLEALRDFNRPASCKQEPGDPGVLDEARAVPEDQLPAVPAARTTAPAHLDGRQPPVRRSGPVLHAEQGRRLAPGQRLGPQAPDPLVPGRPARHDRPGLLQGWRGELCGALLLEVLEGRRTFRVVDPGSEFPIALDAGPRRRPITLTASERT